MKAILVAVAVLLGGMSAAAGSTATLVNLKPSGSPLADVLAQGGFDVAQADPTTDSFSGKVIIWEARGGPISDETLAALGTFVQQGGSLLLGFDIHPGLAPVQLGFLSPTTGWGSQSSSPGQGDTGAEIAGGHADPEIFGQTDLTQIVLPYHFMIRPFHSIERGLARYDGLDTANIFTKVKHTPGDFSWTRPLLNRDWKVRWQASDRNASPLLLTGLYGAGRVAVFAGALDARVPGLENMWAPVLKWLSEGPGANPNEPAAGAAQFTTQIIPPQPGQESSTGGIRVSVQNNSHDPLSLQVLARVLTWEGSPVHDVVMPIHVAAGATGSVDIPMPAVDPQQYQALDWRRAFVVRLGLLSESGATLVQETHLPVDLSPSTGVELNTDNLYTFAYPYPGAPTPDFKGRMGSTVGAYAYPPGQTVNAQVILTNGLHNLAPLATAKDETNPDNVSVVSLTNGASIADKKPRDVTNAYGCWVGKPNAENVLLFHFDTPVTVAGVALSGSVADFRQYLSHNPGSVLIEADGKEVAQATDLDARFVAENGSVHLMFDPLSVTDLRIRLPWVGELANGKERLEPWLGSMEILGTAGPMPQAISGQADLILRDAMTGVETVVAKKDVSVPPGGRVLWSQAITLPAGDGRFYQVEARFGGQTTDVPVLATQPKRTLLAIEDLRPPDAPGMNFIVTRGFRNCFPLGTGTREMTGAWETADDLVWCYAHKMKQVGTRAKTMAQWLYTSENDMAHYSNPWIVFPNGDSVWTAALPNFLDHLKKDKNWADAKTVLFFFSDRWDSGPSAGSQFEWQEMVAFDEYLRGKGGPGLTGRTRAEASDEITQKYGSEWSTWQQQNYTDSLASLHDAFAAEGKRLIVGGQGIPLTSNETAEKITDTISGISDDDTWGMEEDSNPWTTARRLAILAYDPEWKLGMNFVWGWDSGVLQNRYWYAVPGTTEPTRRHYYDSAWRGSVGADGQYKSSFTYGYGGNGGVGWVTSTNDWQQMARAQDRFSLIYPEAPLGAGFIVSSSIVNSVDSTLFTGGGMGGTPQSDAAIHRVTKVLGRLHDTGLSLPFSSNILSLKNWTGSAPLVLLDLSQVTDDEVAILKSLAARGVRIAAFGGESSLPASAASLFGLKPDGTADSAKPAGTVEGTTLLTSGNCLYIPCLAESMTLPMAQQVSDLLHTWLVIPITFPEGTMGYGFVSGGRKYVVLEDWMEQGRMATLRVHADAPHAHAVGLNDHRPLSVTRDGNDWVIQVPLRPGDGEVVVLEEGT